MANYAIVKSGVVIDIALWDGASEWTPNGASEGVTVVECTTGVSSGWTYDGVDFSAPVAPSPTSDDVRREAQRRMVALVGARDADHLDIIITNGSREGIRLLRKGAANWTADDSTRAATLEAVDLAIEAIRAVSNAMEEHPPADYASNLRWPSV